MREKLERQLQESEKYKMHKEALEKEIEHMRGEIDRAETSKAKVLYESEKNTVEMEKIVEKVAQVVGPVVRYLMNQALMKRYFVQRHQYQRHPNP